MFAASTYRTRRDGLKQDAGGNILDEELEQIPIRVGNLTATGTQLQTGNTTPIAIVSNPTGLTCIPIAWHVYYDFSTTAFTGNVSLTLCSTTNATILGTATNAISGSADKTTVGTIASVATDADGDGLILKVGTGDPTAGHASASVKVRVWYVLV